MMKKTSYTVSHTFRHTKRKKKNEKTGFTTTGARGPYLNSTDDLTTTYPENKELNHLEKKFSFSQLESTGAASNIYIYIPADERKLSFNNEREMEKIKVQA